MILHVDLTLIQVEPVGKVSYKYGNSSSWMASSASRVESHSSRVREGAESRIFYAMSNALRNFLHTSLMHYLGDFIQLVFNNGRFHKDHIEPCAGL